MTKRLEAKHKIDRRYGANLWGRAKSPVNSRSYKPGQHGQKGPGKVSSYGLQLAAKQKLRGYWDIGERHFKRMYKEAARRKGDTGENFLDLLERRLVAVIYRMKLAPTVFAARQLVNHGHVLVNGKRVNIPSCLVKDEDKIEVKKTSQEMPMVLGAIQSPERDVPDYVQIDPKSMKGAFLRSPELNEIPYPFQVETNYIIEWYSRRT